MEAAEHRRLGVDLNNATWKMLSYGGPSPEASADERDDLLYGAYASAYHWRHAEGSTVANRARAEHLGVPPEPYASLTGIRRELHHAQKIALEQGWRTVDVTGKSVEEVAREILLLLPGRDAAHTSDLTA